MKILHIINGLQAGGAEAMLYKLLEHSDQKNFEATVISLMDISEIGEKIQSMGIDVYPLNMQRRKISPARILFLVQLIRKIKPDLIQTWMYHADLLGALAAFFVTPRIPVVWGIHHSNLEKKYNRARTLKIARFCAYLSHYVPAKIISCSETAKEKHRQIGYDMGKIRVIPNGFDLDTFHPDKGARELLRTSMGLSQEIILIGMAARFDPQKDHKNFIQAAGILAAKYPNVEFVLCGNGMDEKNQILMDWIGQVGLERKIHLLGHRKDIPQILAALDIGTLSSCGEAFPLAVGEAMACGIPCVVTDVGDSAYIVGETGVVVTPKNPLALADGWAELIEAGPEKREKLGCEARTRIQQAFSMTNFAVRYGEIYKEVMYEPLAVQWPAD